MKLRCLTLTYSFPYPPRSGYNLRVSQLARHLGKAMDQTLLCRHAFPIAPEHMAECLETYREAHVLPIPRPSLPTKILKALAFVPGRYPLCAAGMHFTDMQQKLVQLQANTPFDVIVMEGAMLCSYWPAIRRSNAIRVLNATDVEASLRQRQADIMKPGLDRLLHRIATARMGAVEQWIVRTADLVWTCSQRDQDCFLESVPGSCVKVAPNGVDCASFQPLPPAQGKEILFVGYFGHSPNVDGALYVANEVFPLVRRKIPDATLCIVGRSPTPAIRKLAQIDGVTVAGEVPELEPYYRRSAVSVVPLRAGGGTRLKILESMAYGRPVVSTTIGAEGLEVEHDQHLLIADDPVALADALSEIIVLPEKARALSLRARSLVEEKYDWAGIAARMADEYREQVAKRRKKRP